MRLRFQQKLIVSFLIIFTLFTVGIVIFGQQRARRYKTEALQERLDAYADGVSRYIILYGHGASADSLLLLMPPDLRVTLMDRNGNVWFDNGVEDAASLDNHSARPEIADAVKSGHGTFIRTSASNHHPYLYYAKDNGNDVIVRVALPYNIQVRSFLKPDNGFLYFVILIFIAGLGLIYYVGGRFGRSVRNLRNFSQTLGDDPATPDISEFPDDELGEIGNRLVQDMGRIREKEAQLRSEREKLLLHIQTSAEAICFFKADRSVAFYNGLFMHYFSTITGNNTVTVGEKLPDCIQFREVENFLDNSGSDDYFETQITAHGREYILRLNIFEDRSFEIILTDITAKEKTRKLKQEMTGNIAHELRTPVTSIRGFLEILLSNELGAEKTREYLKRAYMQTRTLSELISDMSLLTKIDEDRKATVLDKVDVGEVIEHVKADIGSLLAENYITFHSDLPGGLIVRGNENLIYSLFRNLTDNVISHAGSGVKITVKLSGVRNGFAFFTFSDNGPGIENDEHLGRLFERFYRVNEGRTRDTGGSGLGLSIVKNAVRLHGGTIAVRNASPHGLEFIFTLPL